MKLDLDNVNALCQICDSSNFDVNVICGRVCVDGSSVMGVMEMCNRVVTLAPVTYSDKEYEEFFEKVKPLGAFKVEGFYG